MQLDELKSTDFTPCLNQAFQLHLEGHDPWPLTLASVTVLGPARVRNGVELRPPFSLIFRGPLQPVLPQRIYALEHERLGRLEIFIVPVGPEGGGMNYEAVFN